MYRANNFMMYGRVREVSWDLSRIFLGTFSELFVKSFIFLFEIIFKNIFVHSLPEKIKNLEADLQKYRGVNLILF
jgi:hypothetical protein